MSNIASVLKNEIARVARREVRAEMETLKKASAQYRGAIAQLRREVADLQKQLRHASRRASAAAPAVRAAGKTDGNDEGGTPRRFSAPRLAAHRAKLGISAAAYGKLVGMSGATIYLWEQGKSRPNAGQLERLATLRAMSRATIRQQLAAE
ncbi:helix-turn-helix transcriptional regulator [Variovorax sp.]|uniref:helix-turn-helix domain-containing protein n=1 Tax=Variovorax sp. TaxID=1871043 RepID=UPI002D400947|nr:helix-turn-helix transcriptional regulator [Variovorax sp.]HYP84137.1 helix-turn-helix transcriptional regulator [Variovorax sp.]